MISALILAGGRATRFGGLAKHELVVDGATIFERQVAVLAPRVDEILVSARADVPGYRTVHDAVDGGGPLAGIGAGLAAARTPWLLVVAGDMPHVGGPIVDLIAGAIDESIDAVGLRIGGLPQPLFCALRVMACRVLVERRLAARQLKASALLTDESLRVRWLEEAAIRAVDPALKSLHNVNAPADL